MCDALLTRRQLLRYSALVAATFPAARLLTSTDALAQAVGTSGLAVPMHLELVTVSDTRAVMTWFTGDPTQLDGFGRPKPVAAPGRVLIGTSPDPRTWVEVGAHEPTAYHHVEVAGLLPGTTYFWRAESGGVVATPSVVDGDTPTNLTAPPVFTTFVPPPGRHLGTVAWMNDLHFGEQVAGLAYSNGQLPGGGLPPGFAVDPENPYWQFMASGAVEEAAARGCTLLLANGDLSAEAEPVDVARCKQTLDGFGTLGLRRSLAPDDDPAYFVTRGNHDRLHTGAAHDACSDHGGGLRDCFGDAFAAGYDPGSTHFSLSIGDDRLRYRFVGLDSNDGAETGVLRASELDYLSQELDRGDLTIPLFHHPASDVGSLQTLPPGVGGLAPADAAAFRQRLVGRENVVGVYAGHTHRNARVVATETGTVPYFEGGAVKEYPGGYTTVRLYEGGYLVNFWKTSTPDARAWSERSRGAYLGLAPNYQLGGFTDRNWTYAVEAQQPPAPVVPDLPAGAAVASITAVAVGAGALAASSARRRRAEGAAADGGGTP